MYEKIGCYQDNRDFGNQVIVYKGKQDYFVIMTDRGEIAYYFVDNSIEKIYPMNSYMRKIGFVYREENNVIDCIDIDLSIYGNANCPEYLRKIIKNMIRS